jgi:hypothetical protein
MKERALPPLRGSSEDGILVFRGRAAEDLSDAIGRVREARLESLTAIDRK